MGAIYDRLELGLEQMKRFLRVDPDMLDDDDSIVDMINAGKEKADEYCNRSWIEEVVAEDGTIELVVEPIPSAVKIWVMQYVGRLYENRMSGLEVDAPKDLSSETWGDVDYSGIEQYRLEPGF